jgi:PBSX family phage terminase large subunit
MADVQLSKLIAKPFYNLHLDIKNHGHSEYWLMGGRGSTKSSFIAIEIILGIMRTPDANAIVYRKVAATLRESVYEQLITAIDWLGVREYFQMRVSPLEIRYKPTGQRIIFRGADDPSKSKSIKISKGYFGFLWFEEAAEFQGIAAIRTIKASIIRGTPPGKHSITFYSYNPPMSAKNWVNEEALKEVGGRMKHASSYLGVPPEWLGAEFIAEAERLKESNERAYRHMYLGEVTGTGGNVFDNLKIHRISPEEFDAQDSFYNGLDFGFAVDPDAFIRWAYDKKRKRLFAVSEYYGARTPTDRLADEIKRRAGREVVRCDSADPRMINELRQRGINAIGVKKGPGSVDHGMRWLQDIAEIIIDPARTPNAAKEFSAYEYAQNKDGEFLSEYPDKDNHLIDASRYALELEIGMRKLQSINKSALGI